MNDVYYVVGRRKENNSISTRKYIERHKRGRKGGSGRELKTARVVEDLFSFYSEKPRDDKRNGHKYKVVKVCWLGEYDTTLPFLFARIFCI